MKEKFRPRSRRPEWLPENIRRPLQDFVDSEVSSGIILLICIVVALIWANSPAASSYTSFWETELTIRFGKFELGKTLLHWINDGLMTIFFFYVGLEIKREVLVGELSSPRQALLPIAAAFGGMIVPALIYTILNIGQPSVSGWGIPMATDIAISLGILALLSHYASLSVKVFLIALAIVDDIGAVLVITFFYNTNIYGIWLIITAGCFLVLLIANWLGLRHPLWYLLFGTSLWYALSQSGVHPTIAGILLAATIPARADMRNDDFLEHAQAMLRELGQKESNEKCEEAVQDLIATQQETKTLLFQMEHALQPWVTFGILPLFAFSNAGVTFHQGMLGSILQPVSLGIILGLLLGKQIGIFLFAQLAVRTGLATLPRELTWKQVYGVGWLAGIGFTMSLFIAQLAFPESLLLTIAKGSILLASLIAGLGSWVVFRLFVSSQSKQEKPT